MKAPDKIDTELLYNVLLQRANTGYYASQKEIYELLSMVGSLRMEKLNEDGELIMRRPDRDYLNPTPGICPIPVKRPGCNCNYCLSPDGRRGQ